MTTTTTSPQQLVADAFVAFNSGDIDAVAAAFAPDLTWQVPGTSPLAGEYRGREAVLGYFGRMMEISGGTLHPQPEYVAPDNDTVLVLSRTTAQRQDAQLDVMECLAFHTADNQVRAVRQVIGDLAAWDTFWS